MSTNSDHAQPDPADIISFWTDEVGESNWYTSDPDIDATIRERFAVLWERVRAQGRVDWNEDAEGVLAALLLLDQFPRNMFRNDPRSFATDKLARSLARRAIAAGHHTTLDTKLRKFICMPLVHSEDLDDQDQAAEAIRHCLGDGETLLHARAHREVIRRFGRFPFRNTALDRDTTPDEATFLEAGGYAAIVRDLRERDKERGDS